MPQDDKNKNIKLKLELACPTCLEFPCVCPGDGDEEKTDNSNDSELGTTSNASASLFIPPQPSFGLLKKEDEDGQHAFTAEKNNDKDMEIEEEQPCFRP